MELKRAAAPNGRQPAWPRRHRTTAKPGRRQRCTPPAASRRGPGAPAFQAVIAGQVRPKVRARHRAPFLQAVHSHARAVHPRARSVRGRARVVHRRARSGHHGVHLLSEWVWSSLAFPFSVQCHPKVAVDYSSGQPAANTRAVLSKEWPYDGRMALRRIWDHMAKILESGGPLLAVPSGDLQASIGRGGVGRSSSSGPRHQEPGYAGNQRVLAWWGDVLHQRCLVEVGEAPPAHRPQRGGRSPATIRPKLVTPKLVTPMSELSHSRRFDRPPITSGLPRLADFLSDRRHVSKALTGTFAK